MLAVGVILTSPRRCRLRRGDSDRTSVAYKCVVASTYAASGTSDALILRSPCHDGSDIKQESCACKTHFWFSHAPSLFPNAAFFAKVEDDSVVHYEGLQRALSHARPVGNLFWASLFQWAAQEQQSYRGKFCGTGAEIRPAWCRYPHRSVTTPFASGGFDLRSRGLVKLTTACEPVAWSNFGSCDGGHGMHLTRCMHRLNRSVLLYDFGWRNWRHSPGSNVLVVHNVKRQDLNVTWQVNLTTFPRLMLASVDVVANSSLLVRTGRAVRHHTPGHAPSHADDEF